MKRNGFTDEQQATAKAIRGGLVFLQLAYPNGKVAFAYRGAITRLDANRELANALNIMKRTRKAKAREASK